MDRNIKYFRRVVADYEGLVKELGKKPNTDVEQAIKHWIKNKKRQPSQKDIDDKLKELQTEWDAQDYARVRRSLYPDIGDQLDDLYKKGAFSDEMAAKIKKVKDDNPKPS